MSLHENQLSMDTSYSKIKPIPPPTNPNLADSKSLGLKKCHNSND